MTIIDAISRNVANDKSIRAFGFKHFIYSVIPIVSYIVEKGMFARVDTQGREELIQAMLKAKKVIKVEDRFEATNLQNYQEFYNALSQKNADIAKWHLLGAFVTHIALCVIFAPLVTRNPLFLGALCIHPLFYLSVYFDTCSVRMATIKSDPNHPNGWNFNFTLS